MSETASKHAEVAASFSALAHKVEDWGVQTPVPEWKARDVVEHLCDWLPGLLASKGVAIEPVEVGDDPASAFDELTTKVQAVLEDEEQASRMVPNEMAGRDTRVDAIISAMYIPDVFMHTLDLAWATGLPSGLDPIEVTAFAQAMGEQAEMLQASGQFGVPLVLDSTHEPEMRLMAVIGRDPNWKRP